VKTEYTYDTLIEQFGRAKKRFEEFESVPDNLFTMKPTTGGWSAAEVCIHIAQFNNLYLQQIDKSVYSAKMQRNENSSIKPGFLYRQFIKFLEPPYKVKVSTLNQMKPANTNISKQAALKKVLKTEVELIRRLSDYQKSQTDLTNIKGSNPVLKWLPMRVADLFLVLEAHQRRHIWQIENTLFKLSGKKY
jgi:hypothetical protein